MSGWVMYTQYIFIMKMEFRMAHRGRDGLYNYGLFFYIYFILFIFMVYIFYLFMVYVFYIYGLYF